MGEPLRVGFLGAGLIATYHSKSLRRSGAPVERTDANGDAGMLTGDELSSAVEPLRDGSENPDYEFVRSVLAGTCAYQSAVADGASVEVGRG